MQKIRKDCFTFAYQCKENQVSNNSSNMTAPPPITARRRRRRRRRRRIRKRRRRRGRRKKEKEEEEEEEEEKKKKRRRKRRKKKKKRNKKKKKKKRTRKERSNKNNTNNKTKDSERTREEHGDQEEQTWTNTRRTIRTRRNMNSPSGTCQINACVCWVSPSFFWICQEVTSLQIEIRSTLNGAPDPERHRDSFHFFPELPTATVHLRCTQVDDTIAELVRYKP